MIRRSLTMAVLALLVVPTFVFGAAPRSKEEEQAVELILQAQAMQESGRHDEALSILENAWTLFPHPKVLFFKARSLMAMKRYDEARATYRIIRSNVRDLQPDKLREVDANLALCEEMLAETEVTFTTPGTEGATLYLDDRPVGVLPLTRTLARGTFRVRAEKVGRTSESTALVVSSEPKLALALVVPPPIEVVDVRPKEGDAVPAAVPASPPRTWGWITFGAGLALTAGGAALLGNNLYFRSLSLASNQHLEGGTVDLALGGTLAGLGLAAVGTATYLLVKPSSAPTLGLAPLPGGAVVTFGGGLR